MSQPDELGIPEAAKRDPRAIELLRVWAAERGQHVSLRGTAWKDPAAWGIFLVDLARHVADAYQQAEGRDRDATLKRIKAGFDAEWDLPTDTPNGKLSDS
jgi:uncharacterized protein DUF5076